MARAYPPPPSPRMPSPGASARGPFSLRLPPLTLVLGGARSGKSAYAEGLFAGQPSPVYVATGQAADAEMDERIQAHRDRRGERWRTVEAPLDLAAALAAEATPGAALLVDCLTLWLSNLLCADRPVAAEIDRLLAALPPLGASTRPATIVFVANEVGLGIVPDNALARAFRDHAGRLNQRLATLCQRVVFVAAGLPLLLKDLP